MRAGMLTERLVIQSAIGASDGQGGTTSASQATVATIWAEQVPSQRATETLQAESVGSHAQYQFRTRVRVDVNASHTASWTPRFPSGHSAMTLQVLGVQPEPGRQTMLLTCAVVQ